MCLNAPTSTSTRVDVSANSSSTITTKLAQESDYDHSRCVICLEQYTDDDSISWARDTMYCNHAFHTRCIKKWLEKKRSCPCCRYGIIRWEHMYVRCNGWNDYCFGRRARVLSDKEHRSVLSKCRETGQYCKEHGLVFPFVPPVLEEPYEPRIQELEEKLQEVEDRFAIFRMRERQDRYQNHDLESQVQVVSTHLTPAESRFPLRIPSNTIDSSIFLQNASDSDPENNSESSSVCSESMSVDEILRKDDATQSTSHYETLGSGGDD